MARRIQFIEGSVEFPNPELRIDGDTSDSLRICVGDVEGSLGSAMLKNHIRLYYLLTT